MFNNESNLWAYLIDIYLYILATTVQSTGVTAPVTTPTPRTVSKEMTTMISTPVPGTSSSPKVSTTG